MFNDGYTCFVLDMNIWLFVMTKINVFIIFKIRQSWIKKNNLMKKEEYKNALDEARTHNLRIT